MDTRSTETTAPTPSDAELKARHRAMWASGDYPSMVETFLLPLGPRLVDACGIRPGTLVLDVAAGTGNASIPAAERGANVTASDLTPELLEAGRRRAEAEGVELEWVQADAEHLPFEDESFDVVMSAIGAMFAPHHSDVARELVRVCRPGGTIALLSWTPDGMIGALFRTMGGFAPAPPPGAQPPPLWGSEDHLRELFGDRVDFRTLERGVLEVTAFEHPRDYGEHFKARYGPTIAARANARQDRARSGVRRGAGPVLRRVEPRHARPRALRDGISGRSGHTSLTLVASPQPGARRLPRGRIPSMGYVHGYHERENERLQDQAGTLVDLLHCDTAYPPGSRVLEAGCGVGAQTVTLAQRSPDARFTSIDVSADSLAEARRRTDAAGLTNVEFRQADIFALPFGAGSFDHVFVCFVLEHLSRPVEALRGPRRPAQAGRHHHGHRGRSRLDLLPPRQRRGARRDPVPGRAAAAAGGDALIGRRLYPLMVEAGFDEVRVSPRMVYVDASRPDLVDGFTRKTFIAMIEGVREPAIAAGLIEPAHFDAGVGDLHRDDRGRRRLLLHVLQGRRGDRGPSPTSGRPPCSKPPAGPRRGGPVSASPPSSVALRASRRPSGRRIPRMR